MEGTLDLPRLTAGAAVVCIWMVVPLARWFSTYLTVTDRRMMVTAGVFIRRRQVVGFEAIKVIEVRQSLLGRALGYGTLRVGSATDTAALRLQHVPLHGLRERLLANLTAFRLRRPGTSLRAPRRHVASLGGGR